MYIVISIRAVAVEMHSWSCLDLVVYISTVCICLCHAAVQYALKTCACVESRAKACICREKTTFIVVINEK